MITRNINDDNTLAYLLNQKGKSSVTEDINNVLELNGLIIQSVHKAPQHATTTAVVFPKAFPTKCLMVIPVCTQLGFNAYGMISVGNVKKTGCDVFVRDSANANMNIDLVAIGY